MNILFEINHPGQVHLLRNLYSLLIKNHKIFVFIKEDSTIIRLLKFYSIPYFCLGTKGSGIKGKLFKQLFFDYKIWKFVLINKIDIGVGSSLTNDHVSIFSKMKAIHLSDDDLEVVPLINKFGYPFSSFILTPESLNFSKYSKKHFGYAGTHELAYLHPNYFKPDPTVLKRIGVSSQEPFYVLRFVALKGHHDVGHKGISLEQKRELISYLSKKGKVFITSEHPIEKEFESYRLPVPPEDIHSLLYYATLFVGDSQTMTSEAAILGTPALKCNTFAGKLSVPNELEIKYELCYSFHPTEFNALFKKMVELTQSLNIKLVWQEKRKKFLDDKIDVTSFFSWFIENYPQSVKIIKSNPECQNNFK